MQPIKSTEATSAAVLEMAAAFEDAAAGDPQGSRLGWYRLAGRPVSVRIAGPKLAERITRAFCHLEVDGEPRRPAELSIELWDAEETGVPRPIRHFRDALDRTWPFGVNVLASSADENVIGFQSHYAASLLDRRAGRIVACIESSDRLSLFERGKPLQPMLFAWSSDHDVVPVHAGLIARGGKGILLGGSGGSGKSTTALMSLYGGFNYLGDDYVGLPALRDGSFQAFSFYNSTWLASGHLARFPWLADYAIQGAPHEDKVLVLLSDVMKDRLAAQAEVRALVLPRVAQTRDTLYREASSAEAVLRLAPSSILQLPFISPGTALDRISELAGKVPTYWLELGTDLEQIPRRVGELLAETEGA